MKSIYTSILAIILITPSALFAQTNRLLEDGPVGIGTTSPVGKLDVRGKTFIGTSDLIVGTSGSFLQIDQGAETGNTYSQIRAYSNGGNNPKNLIFQNSGGNVGIGATNPVQKLDVEGNMLLRNMSNSSGSGASILFSSYGSEHPGPKITSYLDNAEATRSQSRLILSSYGTRYYNEITLVNGNVGIGTLTPDETLTVNGNIHAKEVRIDSSVPAPDYVFDKGYNLLSLAETERYVKTNNHLPDVPSAAEMESKGVNVNEIQMLLLCKVEELTLHLIEKEKQLQKQENRMNVQEQHIKAQQAELAGQKELILQIISKAH
jgi:hypothetical protein